MKLGRWLPIEAYGFDRGGNKDRDETRVGDG